MNLIHQKQSLVVKPLSVAGEGECRRRLVRQISFPWRSGKAIFCPCPGLWEPHAPGAAATYLLCWLRRPFSSWDSALISNKHLLLCWQMDFTQSWGNHDFRRDSASSQYLCFFLVSLPCVLYEVSNFVREIILRASKFQKYLNCYVHMKAYHALVVCFLGFAFFLIKKTPPNSLHSSP